MTVVSNDPSYWPFLNSALIISYWSFAAAVVVVYDWVLLLEQEIELIWRQRWSLMTVLYLVIRYIGIPYSVTVVLLYMPFVSMTNAGCDIMKYIVNGTNLVVAVTLLGVVMIARLYAMYQGSRKMLIFLIVIFLAVNIACIVMIMMALRYIVPEEMILSGVHTCDSDQEPQSGLRILASMIWIIIIVWEVLALCLSVWVGVKHFRELRRFGPSTGSAMGDCLTVLIQSHVLYFASFFSVSGLTLWMVSINDVESNNIGILTIAGLLEILSAVQMFVLGPRLILSVREYHAKIVADPHTGTHSTSIIFQEHIHVSTSRTV